MNGSSRRLLSLCRRRSFLLSGRQTNAGLPTSDGVDQAMLGPLGVEMKRNLTNEWWYSTVTAPNCSVHPLDCVTVTSTTRPHWTDLCSAGVMYANQSNLSLPFGVAQVGIIPAQLHVTSRDQIPSSQPQQSSPLIQWTLDGENLLQLLFLCHPQQQWQWLVYWKRRRLRWWKQFAQFPDGFTLVDHRTDSSSCSSQHYIMYQFPWGKQCVEEMKILSWDEIKSQIMLIDGEAVKLCEADHSTPLSLYYCTHLNRGLLALLFDAYTTRRLTGEEQGEEMKEEEGEPYVDEVLRLHMRLAPINVAVLPEVEDHHELNLYASRLTEELRYAGLAAVFDSKGSLDERLRKQRESGTPFTVIVDEREALTRGVIRLQERDSGLLECLESSSLLHSLLRMFYRFKI